ncbi:MAG TPA: TrkH family potassium uptake protein [Myxococcota bacterium]|nr:TrkH family potassium uptake protein [Myxococcota bacterium]HQK51213.1 TrkH family potassium uptake protein [Myxococcota bacterium]
MQGRAILRSLGSLWVVIAIAQGTSLVPALWFREWTLVVPLLASTALSAACGLGTRFLGPLDPRTLGRREAFAVVALGWVSVSLLGAVPYVLSGALPSPVDAFFESVSGFTTTGSSVVAEPESLPRALLYWRALTQWLGGMGIIVLFLAVFTQLGIGARFLFHSEVPGPLKETLTPHVRDTSAALWRIYGAMTLAQTVLLWVSGMDLFDALLHAFTTLSTGGFSTRAASLAHWNGTAAPLITLVFMVLAGLNFSLYQHLTHGHARPLIRDRETRLYLALLAIATLLVAIDIRSLCSGVGEALFQAAFQVASLMTTTGFVTDDFDRYPDFSRILLVVLMMVGASAGSTAGGIKVVRLLLLARLAHRSLYRLVRPQVVMPIRIGDRVVPETAVMEVSGFFVIYLTVFAVAALYVAGRGIDAATALSSVAATLGNIGPGLAQVGAIRHYGDLPADVKTLLSLLMLLGRLELMTPLALLLPVTWRR